VSAPPVSCHLELDATPRPSAAEVDRLASVAAQLAGRVREERPEDVAAWLVDELPDPVDLWRLLFVQAAAVPVDVPWLTLTSWAHGLDERAPVAADVPAVAELDEVELELAAAGEPVRLRPRERRVVVGRLIEQGHTAREVAVRLGISRRAVQSHLAILRRTAAAQLERGAAA
jgi:DNA-binding CsgD family transcriptional regulator